MKSEHLEQAEFVSWFRKTFDGVRIYAIPNGEKRGKEAAMRLKVEGVTAGVPDLHIPAWSCWIEFKREKGGVVSKEQKDWHEYLRGLNHLVIIARGKDDGTRQILEAFRGVHF